ncbi:MAG: Teichoic acid export ATP-binding protein TagH [uncultured Cytophagales bacterium]|uniref:Teichoic acid export ATP-binding protein TagH n=1 Tax=uncultured Cytophagales bacterium TaxID=158755 RepID=A0A6J4JXM1_9SPHI|nr:MAG: Teichoic acid export ATP-binding protein TagH [uncultured Cytophagales bacterium]
MSVAIKVENIGKKYVVVRNQQKEYTLRGTLTQKVQRMLQPNQFNEEKEEEFWALKDVSFEVNQGDLVGIIGHNGAGKSTVLKIISRITEPTKGSIGINGRVASLLEVGTGFHRELTGRENIYLNGTILGMKRPEIQRKFDEIVAFSEIEKFLDTPVKRYSSGMFMRLGFAVAAHLVSEILIVDEVLAVGDQSFQNKCLAKMEDVSRNEGRTVLFVSHNMSTIKRLCKTGILLKGGRVEKTGNITDVAAEYLKPVQAIASTENIFTTKKYGILGCEVLAADDADAYEREGAKPDRTILAHQQIMFRFFIRISDRMRGKIGLGGSLRDAGGITIGTTFSDYYGTKFAMTPDEVTEIRVINEGMRLSPGRYTFYPSLYCNDEKAKSLVEAVHFNVLPSDIFGFGYNDFQGQGPIVWNARWEQVEADVNDLKHLR